MPKIFVPEKSSNNSFEGLNLSDSILSLYAANTEAYNHLLGPENDDSFIPRMPNLDRDKLALSAIEQLEIDSNLNTKPDLFFDVMSTGSLVTPAPTYKLSYLSGITKAFPLSFDGMGGVEIIMAFNFAESLLENNQIGLLVLTQCIQPPNIRVRPQEVPLGDGAASLILSPEKTKITGSKIRFLGGRVYNISSNEVNGQRYFNYEIEKFLEDSHLSSQIIDWGISQFGTKIHDQTFDWFNRPKFRFVDFGSVDIFITLHYLCKSLRQKISNGIILIKGEENFCGLLLLQIEKE